MQCKKCGENFNGMFCPKCGTKIDDEQVITANHKNSSIIVRLMILFSIICFAFPFFNVSCSASEEISVDYSGFQLVGIVEPDEDNDKLSDDSGNNEKLNVFVGVSLVALAAAFVLTFIKAAKKYTFICTVVSAGALMLSKLTFSSYYNFKDYEAEIVVTTKLGFYFAMVMIIISALVAYIIYNSNYGSTQINAPVAVLPGPDSVSPQNITQPEPPAANQPEEEKSDTTVIKESEDIPTSSESDSKEDLQKTNSD